ncbi:MAG: Ig-like domain-containing protein [Clostridia bacterium]|nr:Ig-like domain-containing protein [Clostridia bacterium]MBQ9798259.1 Ig-like domain-containing protein [Clostridia bacterium]
MKYTNKLKITRSLSFLLVMLLLLVQIPFSAMALEIEDENLAATLPNTEEQDNRSAGASSLLGIGEKSYAELQTLRVEDVVRPEVVTLAMAQEKGHVNRLTAQEQTLNSVMFQNLDGSKTTYVFSDPVKYVTANGDVRDKSTALTAQNGSAFAYAMTDNSVNVYFGAKLAWGGVKTVYDGNSVTLKPVTTANPSPTLGADGKSVTYAGAFGNGTALQYRTLLNGVKEDIVLNSNVGQSSFAFNMTLDGFTPELRDGVWCLLDDRDVAVLSLGKVLVKDSANNEVLGTMNVTANKLGGYTVTVTAPEDFLNDENTVYPVYVDPMVVTIYETYTNYDTQETETGIYDLAVYCDYETYSAVRPNIDNFNIMGGDYADVYYQLPAFLGDSYYDYSNLAPEQLGKVMFYVRLHEGAAGKLYASGVPYDPYITYEDDVDSMVEPSVWGWLCNNYRTEADAAAAAGLYGLDITALARAWLRFNSGESTDELDNPALGFIVSGNFTAGRRVAVINDRNYAGMYYTVDYDTGLRAYYSDFSTGKFLVGVEAEGYSGGLDKVAMRSLEGWDAMWVHEYQGNSTYYIGIQEEGTVKYLNAVPTVVNETTTYELLLTETKGTLWQIHLANGGGVVMRFEENTQDNVVNYNKALGRSGNNVVVTDYVTSDQDGYSNIVWRKTVDSFPIMTGLTISLPYDHNNISPGSTIGITKTPIPANATWQNTTDYKYESLDPSVATISETGLITGVSAGIATIVVTHKQTGVMDWCAVFIGNYQHDNNVPVGDYFIKNVASLQYLEIGQSSSTPISMGDFSMEDSSIWRIEIVGASPEGEYQGYYTIKSVSTGKYLGVDLDQSSPRNRLKLFPSNSGAATKWIIQMDSDGAHKILPLSVPHPGMLLEQDSQQPYAGVSTQTNNQHTDDDFWYLQEISVYHEVEHIYQDSLPLCWMSAAIMFADHYIDATIHETVLELYNMIRPNQSYSGGTIEETKEAIDKLMELYEQLLIIEAQTDKILSKENLGSILFSGDIVVVGRGNYQDITDSTTRNSGHATVILGYVTYLGMDDEQRFIVMDSAFDDTPIYLMSYEKLVNDANAQWDDVLWDSDPDSINNQRVWDRIIIRSGGQPINYIPYYFDQED